MPPQRCPLRLRQLKAASAAVSTDASGATIPGATVVVQEARYALVRAEKTDSNGHYALRNLTPGSYRIDINAPGFEKQSLVENIASSQQALRNIILSVGHSSETVTVDAASVQLETQSRTEAICNSQGKERQARATHGKASLDIRDYDGYGRSVDQPGWLDLDTRVANSAVVFASGKRFLFPCKFPDTSRSSVRQRCRFLTATHGEHHDRFPYSPCLPLSAALLLRRAYRNYRHNHSLSSVRAEQARAQPIAVAIFR